MKSFLLQFKILLALLLLGVACGGSSSDDDDDSNEGYCGDGVIQLGESCDAGLGCDAGCLCVDGYLSNGTRDCIALGDDDDDDIADDDDEMTGNDDDDVTGNDDDDDDFPVDDDDDDDDGGECDILCQAGLTSDSLVTGEDGLVSVYTFGTEEEQQFLVYEEADSGVRGGVRGASVETLADGETTVAVISDLEDGLLPTIGVNEGVRGGVRGKIGRAWASVEEEGPAVEEVELFDDLESAKDSLLRQLDPTAMAKLVIEAEGRGEAVRVFCFSAYQFMTFLSYYDYGVLMRLIYASDPRQPFHTRVQYATPFTPEIPPVLSEILQNFGEAFYVTFIGRNLPPVAGRWELTPDLIQQEVPFFPIHIAEGGCQSNFFDWDQDGFDDPEDNCPEVPNADQSNSDAQPPGDACQGCVCGDGWRCMGPEMCDGFSGLPADAVCAEDCQSWDCLPGFLRLGSICVPNPDCGDAVKNGLELCDTESRPCHLPPDGPPPPGGGPPPPGGGPPSEAEPGYHLCNESCDGFGECQEPTGTCGNGVIEGVEACDSDVLACSDPMGCYLGTRQCTADCLRYDKCDMGGAMCGNGIIDGCEECDDGEVNGQPEACGLDCRIPILP